MLFGPSAIAQLAKVPIEMRTRVTKRTSSIDSHEANVVRPLQLYTVELLIRDFPFGDSVGEGPRKKGWEEATRLGLGLRRCRRPRLYVIPRLSRSKKKEEEADPAGSLCRSLAKGSKRQQDFAPVCPPTPPIKKVIGLKFLPGAYPPYCSWLPTASRIYMRIPKPINHFRRPHLMPYF